jgi:hypothetical protein
MDSMTGEAPDLEICTRPFAPTAKQNVKYLSSPPRVGLYTAGIAFLSTGNPGSKSHNY